MDIEELQADLDWFEKGVPIEGGASPTERMDRIVAAARMWLNPNIEQIAQRLHNQRIRGVKCYEAFPEECTCMADAEAVAAAFTPQGGIDE